MARSKRPPKQSRKAAAARHPVTGAFPSRDEVLAYLKDAQGKIGKREIARAFGIKGADRLELKSLLADLAADGLIAGSRKHLKARGSLPSVAVLEIVDRDSQGDLLAEPVAWDADEGPKPRVLVAAGKGRRRDPDGALGPGDRILARIAERETREDGDVRHEAEIIKKLPRERRRLLGIFRSHARGGGVIDPIDRRDLKTWPVREGGEGDAGDGDLVRFEVLSRHRGGVPEARVAESLGNPKDDRQISLIAVHSHGIPDEFPAAVLMELETLPDLDRRGRTDLTKVPLLTIDPPDARDHDDAVAAEADTDPKNPGGHIVTVAIADVAYYVRRGRLLDREAELRGNSCYFPDRVVPMLPERISNDLCSLREGELRPCMAVTMVFDANGRKLRHQFQRGLMRSAAKLSYQEAQAAIDGSPSDKAGPLLDGVLKPLWAAYRTLARGRDNRAPLDLDLPERKILMGPDGHVANIIIPERLEAHRLIEEMMIQANVAAAETLEARTTPCVYRIHDKPSKEKLASLSLFLESLDIKLPKGEGLKPKEFNRILGRAKDLPVGDLVNEVVLRSQSQAEYATQNIGHFGLNLGRYAHFTSPIRRYADLLVHRALIRAMKLGDDGLSKDDEPRLSEVAKAISDTERRAMAAERETSDRLLAAYLAERIGAEFPARISGVTRSGLFVRLRDTGADGFVPMSTLGAEYFRHDETLHAVIGERSHKGYRLGDSVDVRLVEAVPTAGALRFEMLSEPQSIAGASGVRRGRRLPGRLGRPKGRGRRR
ncbi:MAG: ribonuclease R [Hyphomicrobiaceae bacterium]